MFARRTRTTREGHVYTVVLCIAVEFRALSIMAIVLRKQGRIVPPSLRVCPACTVRNTGNLGLRVTGPEVKLQSDRHSRVEG